MAPHALRHAPEERSQPGSAWNELRQLGLVICTWSPQVGWGGCDPMPHPPGNACDALLSLPTPGTSLLVQGWGLSYLHSQQTGGRAPHMT